MLLSKCHTPEDVMYRLEHLSCYFILKPHMHWGFTKIMYHSFLAQLYLFVYGGICFIYLLRYKMHPSQVYVLMRTFNKCTAQPQLRCWPFPALQKVPSGLSQSLLPHSSIRPPPICFLLLQVCLACTEVLHKRKHTVCTCACMAYFASHGAFEMHPCWWW